MLASSRTPPDLVLRGLDTTREIRRSGVTVISGFHSPLERATLRLLLRGSQPLVACMARRLDDMPVPTGWRVAVDAGRMLLVGSNDERGRRASTGSARKRNRLVAALAAVMLVVHARAGSRTYETAVEALDRGKRVYCFDHPANADLLLLGASPLSDPRETFRSIELLPPGGILDPPDPRQV